MGTVRVRWAVEELNGRRSWRQRQQAAGLARKGGGAPLTEEAFS